MANSYADFLRERMARERISPTMPQGGSSDQVYSVPSGGYGSLPLAPPPPEQARIAAAQRLAAALLNEKLRRVRAGEGGATPQSQMTNPQLQAQGPAYGSQAARVAANPSAAPIQQPDIPQGMNIAQMPPQTAVNDSWKYIMPENTQGMASDIQTMPNPDNPVEIASNVINDPKGSAISVFKKWMEVSDMPRQWSTDKIGDAVYEMAVSDTPPDWVYGIPGGDKFWREFKDVMTPEQQSAIIVAHNSGGGNGVWENVIAAATNDMPWYVRAPIRIGTDFAVDPLGYPLAVATGGSSILARGATESAITGDTAAAALQKLGSQVLGAPQKVLDVTADLPFNLAGKGIQKAMSWVPGNLLSEAAPTSATEDVNQAAEFLSQQQRIKDEGLGLADEGGDVPPTGGPDVPPTPSTPDMPRYTKTVQDGKWVILDPNGIPVAGEEFPYKPPRVNDITENMEARVAQKRVNELNYPQVRDESLSMGAVLPNENAGLTFTDPLYEPLTMRGKNAPMRIQDQVAFMGGYDPAVRQAWLDEWTPKAKNHEEIMGDFTRDENSRSTGLSFEKDLVQRGTQLLYPEKVMEMMRFYVDDTLLPFMQTFPGTPPKTREWITTPNPKRLANGVIDPKNDIVTLMEHAVFGSREDAIAARKALRSRSFAFKGMSPYDSVERLAQMGESINGPGWRSTDPSAVKSRTIRGAKPPRGTIDEAAVSEIAGRVETPRSIQQANPGMSYKDAAIESQRLKSEQLAAMAEPTAEDLPQQTVTVDPAAGDAPLVEALQQPGTKVVTPAGNVVEAKNPGEVTVKKAGAAKPKVKAVKTPAGPVEIVAKDGDTPVVVDTIADAVTVIDESMTRYDKGIDLTPEQIQRAADSVPDMGYRTTSLDNLQTSIADFQNRKSDFSQESVDNILNNYDPRVFDPIEVKPNGDGTYTILSGHSRHEAWKRMAAAGRVDPNAVPIRVQTGTPEELRLLAQTSNTRGTPNTPVEKGRLLNDLMASGKSWDEALRAVNVNSAEGKRLVAVTNLSPALREDVDAGRLSVRMGALLGDSIQKGVITVTDADQVFIEKIAGAGISESQLRVFLEAAAIAKAKIPVTQNDIFGGFSVMSMAIKDTEDLVRIQKELTRQQELLTKAGKSSEIDDITRSGLNRAVGNLQQKLDDVLSKMQRSNIVYQADPALAERSRRNILEKAGALTGQGASDADILARNDRSYVGAAYQMGKLDTETYLGLNQIVEWNGQPMKLWEAFDEATAWLGDPVEANRVLANQMVNPETAAQLMAKTRDRSNHRVIYKLLGAYQSTLNAMRQMTMFNWARGWAGAISDVIGTNYSLIINGEMDAARRNLDLLNSARHFVQDERGKGMVVENLPGMEKYVYQNGVQPPASTMQLVETRFETHAGKMELQRLPKPLAVLTRPLADPNIMAVRTAMDRNSRYSLHMAAYDQYIDENFMRFRGMVAERAQRTGNDYVDWLKKIDELGSGLNSDDVLEALGDARLARDWRELTKDARGRAKKRVDELLFSYKATNLDNKLKNVVFFHYWTSRALPMHAKTVIRNPWLLNAYSRAWNVMQNEAEQNGYPPTVRGYLKVMGDMNTGFYGLINPVQVLVPFGMLIESSDDPGVFAFMKRWGLFINPLIEAAAASLGWTNTVPDLTATLAVRRAMRYTVNYLNNNGFDGIVPDQLGDPNTWQPSIVDEAQFRLINMINGLAVRAADSLAPTQKFINDFTGISRNAYESDTLNSILIHELEKEYGPYDTWAADSLAYEKYLDARTDIELGRSGNPLAETVTEIMSDAKMKVALLNTFVPAGIYQRYGPRDQQMANGERDARTLETSGSPEDAALTTGIDAMDKLGTETGRNAYSAWNEIAFLGQDGSPIDYNGFIQIGDEKYYAGDIKNMSDDDRKALADRWVAQYGATDELATYRAQREAYIAKHPEVGDFKEYQKGVYGMQSEAGGIKAWREKVAGQDKDFASAMAETEKRIRDEYPWKTDQVVDIELDRWAASQSAYKVLNGIRDSVYDKPMAKKTPDIKDADYGFSSSAAPGASGGSSQSSQPKTELEKTQSAIENYNTKIEKAVTVMNASGYDVTAEDLMFANPYYRKAWGMFDIPEMPYDATLYWSWRLLQPAGADTSVAAYISVLQQNGQLAA